MKEYGKEGVESVRRGRLVAGGGRGRDEGV